MSKKKQSNEHIQVFVRCRPLLKSEVNAPVPVEVHVNKILVRDTGADKYIVKSFLFDKVFGPEAKQADVYSEVVAPIIQEVITGFNCTIFAYGQTGTGKTFTIEGGRTAKLEDRSEDPLSGIIPRSMKHLFNDLTSQNVKFEISVSFLELYNEEIFDLLSKTDDPVKLKMFDNSMQKGSVIVQGLEVRSVTSMQEVYTILDEGSKKRRKAATLLNKASSRSHTIFTVIVKIEENSSTLEKTKSGKLNLVDLAGSENIGRSGAIHKTAREAGNINQSLLALGRVITSLCEKARHIPYRESKLTRLLQDSLGGQTKTAIIATISPSAVHIDETLNTLEYALRAKSITNKPELNTQVTVSSLTKDYLEEINRLKKGIYEVGRQKGLYVPEENLRNWESTLASKREEKFNILSQIESRMEESKSLDIAIEEANNCLTEKRSQLEEAKVRYEEHRVELETEKKEQKLYEGMFQIIQSMHDYLHDKLHKELEETQGLELELMKGNEKLKLTLEEHRNLDEKLQNIRGSRRQRKEQFHDNAENILNNIKNMHYNVDLLTSECKDYISVLEKGFEFASKISENEYLSLFKALKDLEAINNAFQEEIEIALREERSTKLEWINEFYEAYLTSNESSILEPLNKILNYLETSLLEISSTINDWKKSVTLEINDRQTLMKEHLDSQKATLESMTDCLNTLLNKHKENLGAFSDIVNECVNLETTNKKVWEDRFLSVDQALSSLDIFCTEHVIKEVDKATELVSLYRQIQSTKTSARSKESLRSKLERSKKLSQLMAFSTSSHAHGFLRNSSRLGSEIAEKLTTYCETSVKSMDVMQEKSDLSERNAFSNKWEEMKKRVDTSCAICKDLNSELATYSNMSQNVDSHSSHIEDTLKKKFKTVEQSAVSTCSEKMLDSILKCGDFYKACLVENQKEVDTSLLKDKMHFEKLVESSKQLSDSLSTKVSGYIQNIETEKKKSLTTEDIETSNRTEGVISENTLFNVDTTITSSGCLEATINGNECPVCANIVPDETLHYDENAACSTATVPSSQNLLKVPKATDTTGSTSFKYLPVSPVRGPRNRPCLTPTLPIARKLQFLDGEKLTNKFLECSSDEEI